MAKLHCRAESQSSCLVTSVSSLGAGCRWHLHSPCTLAVCVPSGLATAGPALTSPPGVQSSHCRKSRLWMGRMGNSSSTGGTFTAKTYKAMLNPALPFVKPGAAVKPHSSGHRCPLCPFKKPSLLGEGCSRVFVSLETFLEAGQVPFPSSLATRPAWRVPEQGTVVEGAFKPRDSCKASPCVPSLGWLQELPWLAPDFFAVHGMQMGFSVLQQERKRSSQHRSGSKQLPGYSATAF